MKDDALWKFFSLFIRLRDSKDGFGNCCTCNKRIHYKEAHAGHFISRRHQATKFNEKNVALQCAYCNLFNQGEQYKFAKYLDERYGKGTAEELLNESKKMVKRSKVELEELKDFYKSKVKELSSGGLR